MFKPVSTERGVECVGGSPYPLGLSTVDTRYPSPPRRSRSGKYRRLTGDTDRLFLGDTFRDGGRSFRSHYSPVRSLFVRKRSTDLSVEGRTGT